MSPYILELQTLPCQRVGVQVRGGRWVEVGGVGREEGLELGGRAGGRGKGWRQGEWIEVGGRAGGRGKGWR